MIWHWSETDQSIIPDWSERFRLNGVWFVTDVKFSDLQPIQDLNESDEKLIWLKSDSRQIQTKFDLNWYQTDQQSLI